MSLPLVGAGPSAVAESWTPAQSTDDGGHDPVFWVEADAGTWQDTVGGTAADDDGEVIGPWEDQSANEDDVTQGTADNKPILKTGILNGKPVVRFDGSNDWLQGAFTSALSQPFTVFIVVKLSADADDDVFYNIVDSDDATNRMLIQKSGTPDPDAWNINAGTNLQGNAADNDWHIWTVLFSGASSQFWLDGVSEASGNAGAHDPDGITIGAIYATTGGYFDGDIAGIIIYDANLSDADKNQVAGYLSDKYAISYSDI